MSKKSRKERRERKVTEAKKKIVVLKVGKDKITAWERNGEIELNDCWSCGKAELIGKVAADIAVCSAATTEHALNVCDHDTAWKVADDMVNAVENDIEAEIGSDLIRKGVEQINAIRAEQGLPVQSRTEREARLLGWTAREYGIKLVVTFRVGPNDFASEYGNDPDAAYQTYEQYEAGQNKMKSILHGCGVTVIEVPFDKADFEGWVAGMPPEVVAGKDRSGLRTMWAAQKHKAENPQKGE